MSTFTYAIQLSEDNIDAIVELGAQHHLNLADFRDDIEVNAEDGFDTFAIAVIDVDADKLIKISTTASIDFTNSWVMHPSDQYRQFTRISRR